jgi:hypothetical protein
MPDNIALFSVANHFQSTQRHLAAHEGHQMRDSHAFFGMKPYAAEPDPRRARQ